MNEYIVRREHHMYKSWIRENPQLAMERIMASHDEMMELGMMVRVEENEHYYDVIGEKL